MPITQTMIDLCHKWIQSSPQERWKMCPVIYDAFVEGGYPNMGYNHFNQDYKPNATDVIARNPCCANGFCEAIVCVLTNYNLKNEISDEQISESRSKTPRW